LPARLKSLSLFENDYAPCMPLEVFVMASSKMS